MCKLRFALFYFTLKKCRRNVLGSIGNVNGEFSPCPRENETLPSLLKDIEQVFRFVEIRVYVIADPRHTVKHFSSYGRVKKEQGKGKRVPV